MDTRKIKETLISFKSTLKEYSDNSATSMLLGTLVSDIDVVLHKLNEVYLAPLPIVSELEGKISCISYENKTYTSLGSFLRAHNISAEQFSKVTIAGYSLQTALGYCLGIVSAKINKEIALKVGVNADKHPDKHSLEVRYVNDRVAFISYNSEKYRTRKECIEKLSLSEYDVLKIMRGGYSLEIALRYCLNILDESTRNAVAKVFTRKLKNINNQPRVTIDGQEYVGLNDISNKLGMTRDCLYIRLKHNWSWEDIINTPQNTNLGKARKIVFGERKFGSLMEFAEAYNLNYDMISHGKNMTPSEMIAKFKNK